MKQFIRENKFWLFSLAAGIIVGFIYKSLAAFIYAQMSLLAILSDIHTILNKKATVRSKVLARTLEILGILYVAPSIIVSFIFAYNNINRVIVSFVLNAWAVLIFLIIAIFLLLKLFVKTTHYRVILSLRYIWNIIRLVFLFIVLLTIMCIAAAGSYLPYIENFYLKLYFSSALLTGGIAVFFSVLFLAVGKQKLLYLKKPLTILYLRSFANDDSPNDIHYLDLLTEFSVKNGYQILKVGNPNKIFTTALYTTLYLPTSNWKFHVNKLIEFSKSVFVVMGQTEGLVWEILSHTEYWDKYMFHIPDKQTLDYWINISKNKDRTELIEILKEFESIIGEKGLSFCIEKGWLYYSDNIYDIIHAHESGKVNYNTVNCYPLNSASEQFVKVTSDRVCTLYNENKEEICIVTPQNSVFLSHSEFNRVKYFKQKSAIQHRPVKHPESFNQHITKVHIPTVDFFKIYLYEYVFYRIFYETAFLAIITFLIIYISKSDPPIIIIFILGITFIVAYFFWIMCIIFAIYGLYQKVKNKKK